jgi:hypothetical protein
MASQMINHLFHSLILGPAFIYIGYAREQIPDAVFYILMGLSVVLLLYHLYRAVEKIKEGKSAWVNWIHIFLIAPLLFIVGYLGKDASRRYFEMMLLLGFAATGYHGLYAIKDLTMGE